MMEDATPAVRYARYAVLRRQLLTDASKRIPLASVASQARALSLWDGKQVRPGDEMQLAAVFDLGVLDPVGDHHRAIERQERAEPPEPGSDAARLLHALAGARYGIYRFIGPRAEGGVAAEAFPEAMPVVIWDNHLARNRAPGALFGARLAWPDADLALTCGTAIALDSRALERLLLGTPPQRGPVLPSLPLPDDVAAADRLLAEPAARLRLAALAAAPGFAARVYRTAIDLGLMGAIPGRTPPELLPQR